MFRYDQVAEFNKRMSRYLNKKELNFARLILPSKQGDVSVVGKYAPTYYDKYRVIYGEKSCFLKESNGLQTSYSNEYDNFYYGQCKFVHAS